MQKILLIGNLDNTLSNIYKSLQGKYQVQICKMEFGEVETMMAIVKPDLALVNMYRAEGFDVRILDYMQQSEPKTPVVFIGTIEECGDYICRYNSSMIGFLERPVTQGDLLSKCQMILDLAESKKRAGASVTSKERKKILVVDDSGVFLRTMKALLENKYEVVLAKTGEKALSIAITDHPDLILLDYEMPEWDGRLTLEKLREREKTAQIPVVFLTGVSDRKHILAVLKMQPQGYLLKPVDSEELEKKLQEILGA